MAIHDGLETTGLIDATESAVFEASLDRALLASDSVELIDSPGMATASSRSPVAVGGSKAGVLSHNFGQDQVYERIWLTPSEIDAGFIAESQAHNISIWNAFQAATKQITGIAATAPNGTTLAYGALPITLPATGEQLHVLTILKDGPVTQDTTYTYTVNGVEYEIDVVGTRIVPFVFEPNWISNVKISYEYLAALQANTTFTEQRRPLSTRCYREISFSIFEKDLEAQEVENCVAYGHNKILAVPLYTEPLHTTTAITGALTVTITETVSERWNLVNLTDYVLLLDFASGAYAVKEIETLSGQDITFTRLVEETLDKNTTVIYPLMVCYFENFRLSGETKTFVTGNAVFKELRRG